MNDCTRAGAALQTKTFCVYFEQQKLSCSVENIFLLNKRVNDSIGSIRTQMVVEITAMIFHSFY